MILATRFTLFLKEVEKTCIFTQNWLDHLLLVTSYLVTIATITTLVSKCARGINEQPLKTSGTDVLSSRKKLRPPPPHPSPPLVRPRLKIHVYRKRQMSD